MTDESILRDGWRDVVAYYMGDEFTDAHTAEECRDEAVRRALDEGQERLVEMANAETWRTKAETLEALLHKIRRCLDYGADEGPVLCRNSACVEASIRGLVKEALGE